jgi:hypothetical protein
MYQTHFSRGNLRERKISTIELKTLGNPLFYAVSFFFLFVTYINRASWWEKRKGKGGKGGEEPGASPARAGGLGGTVEDWENLGKKKCG